MKLAFLTTHPIQYQVPVFRHLAAAEGVDFQTLFCTIPNAKQQGAEFGVEFEWDLPLLEGYKHHVLDNVSANPGLMHYSGCDTPGVGEYLRANRFDAVVVNGWVVKSCIQTMRACRRLKIPCIVRGEANNLRPRAWWKRMIHRRLMNYFSAYCPIGTASADFYRELGIPEHKMFLAPYCIENDRFECPDRANPDAVRAAREELGLPSDKACFLFCGKFIRKKNPDQLLKAVRMAADEGANFHVLMVGDGELRPECEHYARKHQLPVTFTGFMNQGEIKLAYLASDCLALPSDNGETWGLVVNEAFAAGMPAIVSDQVGCWKDLIKENSTGSVFPFAEIQELAKRLVEFSLNRQRLLTMGRQAKVLIESFSPRHAANGVLEAARAVTRS